MDRRRLASAVLALIVICAGCSAPEPTRTRAEPRKPASGPTPEPATTPQPTTPDRLAPTATDRLEPTDTPDPGNTPSATPSPRPAGDIGWRQVSGVVYAGAQAPGNELPGALVRCSQHSYSAPPETSCAPYRITTASDGTFEFDVFVHDTDGITISAEREGYQPDEYQIGGFDCVGTCPHVALVLEMGS
jgi:hypothetical protein